MEKRFGTAPVFFTAISTILGAILFLRFGFAVGTLGFYGTLGIILLGHLVTIPTALAISELATNKRVEGGGEYFIISRSFGLNIGATIGIALYLSQAISVAFYIIAFTESFEMVFDFLRTDYNIDLPRQVISIPAMLGLSAIMLYRGASMGVKTLYIVVAILFISLILFFIGSGNPEATRTAGAFEFRNSKDFFIVFAIIFPAFTGMTAGVGLSGELKNPAKSIPMGTILGTTIGLIVYFFVVYKLATSLTVEQMLSKQLIMTDVAVFGSIIIPIGLAASTLSSALGSIMVAPRTLQALSRDEAFPSKNINKKLSASKGNTSEPFNATLVTCTIALVFVAAGNVNAVAGIISMFFMVTYGSLCLISFLNHFGASPAYRPSFRSRWYISLLGFLTAVWVMFKIDPLYALLSIIIIIILYIGIAYYHSDRKGLESIFANTLFQVNRELQLFLQRATPKNSKSEWRPGVICISADSFKRSAGFDLLNWLSYRYGFGTYIHLIEGYYSKSARLEADETYDRLLKRFGKHPNHVFVDTMISPSYTSAIAQIMQLPGISGMDNNMIVFEYDKQQTSQLERIIENYGLVHSGNFDVAILATDLRIQYNFDELHLWLNLGNDVNPNLLILLSYTISGHPLWAKSTIRIFTVCKANKLEESQQTMNELIQKGRLPISINNIEFITEKEGQTMRSLMNEKSREAGLTLIGFRTEHLKHEGIAMFEGYDEIGNMLFVNSQIEINIE